MMTREEAKAAASLEKPRTTNPSVGETEMVRYSVTISSPKLSWFTPRRLLVIFCLINLLNYLDQGAIASNGVNGSSSICSEDGTCTLGTGIQGDFNLSNFQDGILSSAFLVGLLVASPIFASLARSVNPFRLIGVGLAVWTLAVAGCGFSSGFWMIAICRVLVGVGEASFISLAAPFIDDSAPVAKKTVWLGVFYMCVPSGYAMGYIYGGLVGQYNWRYAFFGEAILMFPFAVLGFVMKPLQLKGFAPVESKKALTNIEKVSPESQEQKKNDPCYKGEQDDNNSNRDSRSRSKDTSDIVNQFVRFFKEMKELSTDKVFVVNVLGNIAYNFVLGAYSYWGPKACKNIYNMNNVDTIFGGITVVCGILGTLAGGFVLDFINSTISNAFKLLSVTTFIGAVFCFVAFSLKSMYAFLALFAVGELLIFATQGPTNYIILHCVKPSIRPLSMVISTICIHVFGDVPSSPLVGVLQDQVNNWRETSLIVTAILFPAAAIWFTGIFLHSTDKFDEDNEPEVSCIEWSKTTPLLEDEKAETTQAP